MISIQLSITWGCVGGKYFQAVRDSLSIRYLFSFHWPQYCEAEREQTLKAGSLIWWLD